MKPLNELVVAEVEPMLGGEVMHADESKLSLEQRLVMYGIIQFEQDKLAKRREVLNARIKADVKQVGTTNDKGHMRFEVHGTIATVEKRVSKMPNEEALATVLAKAGLSLEDVTDTVTVKQVNPSKIDYLIELGKLKAADIEALQKVTYALTVDSSEVTTQRLTEATKSKLPMTEEAPPAKKSSKKAKSAA